MEEDDEDDEDDEEENDNEKSEMQMTSVDKLPAASTLRNKQLFNGQYRGILQIKKTIVGEGAKINSFS